MTQQEFLDRAIAIYRSDPDKQYGRMQNILRENFGVEDATKLQPDQYEACLQAFEA